MTQRSFGKHVTGIYRHLQIIINHDLNPYGLGSGQYIFFSTIAEHEGISQKELSALIQIDKTTTAKAIKKLESEGYINRLQDPTDRRFNQLYLTEKGKAFIPLLREKLRNTTKVLTANMDEKQKEVAFESLQLMMSNAVDAVAKIREED